MCPRHSWSSHACTDRRRKRHCRWPAGVDAEPVARAHPEHVQLATDPSCSPTSPNSGLCQCLDARPCTTCAWRRRSNNLLRLKRLYVDIPRVSRTLDPDVVLTLGDLGAIQRWRPHVVFLHNACLVGLPDEGRRGRVPSGKERYMRWHLGRSVRAARFVVVQTPVMAARLSSQFAIARDRIVEIAPPVPDHVTKALRAGGTCPAIERVIAPVKLLFLAADYPHKNHAIIPAVVTELRRRGLAERVHFFVTLDESSSAWANITRSLLNHASAVTNLGRVPMTQVADALRAASALFLPTLAESYGLVYLEAMACRTRIITSDRDFARWMSTTLRNVFRSARPAVDRRRDRAETPRRSAGVHSTSREAAVGVSMELGRRGAGIRGGAEAFLVVRGRRCPRTGDARELLWTVKPARRVPSAVLVDDTSGWSCRPGREGGKPCLSEWTAVAPGHVGCVRPHRVPLPCREPLSDQVPRARPVLQPRVDVEPSAAGV